jgi:hypothetical protein
MELDGSYSQGLKKKNSSRSLCIEYYIAELLI